MVGMNMRVEDAGNVPAPVSRQIEIHLRVEGGIDDEGFFLYADEVGKTAFARAPHLDNMYWSIVDSNLGTTPGKTPGFHATFQGKGVKAVSCKEVGGNLTDFATGAHGHDRLIGRKFHNS